MKKRLPKTLATLVALALALALSVVCLSGCNSQSGKEVDATAVSSQFVHSSTMELEEATGFSVDYYEGGYKLVTIKDSCRLLVVPEGKEAPSDLSQDVVVVKQPLDQVYLVATAAMDLLRSIDSMGCVTLTGTKQNGWHIPEAAQMVASGEIIYAGKYSMPDYELILNKGCDLAIGSTMIYHTPDVKEALEGYGIPVMVDQSSYEQAPLGRCEWVKLYGALLNKEEAANKAFDRQKALYEKAVDTASKKGAPAVSVAFFYISSNGEVNVRKSSDYIPQIINAVGGSYVFEDLVNESHSSTVSLQMENFISAAKDADVLIYNSAIEGAVKDKDELLKKAPMLEKFKAVKKGNVWCTAPSLYQEAMAVGSFAEDLRKVCDDQGVDDGKLQRLYRLR